MSHYVKRVCKEGCVKLNFCAAAVCVSSARDTTHLCESHAQEWCHVSFKKGHERARASAAWMKRFGKKKVRRARGAPIII
jgi:hypothetical protein